MVNTCSKTLFVEVLEGIVEELQSYIRTLESGDWPLEKDALPETVEKLRWLLGKMRQCANEEILVMVN